MSESNLITRRTLCKQAAVAVPVFSAIALAGQRANAADMPALSPDDPQAKALQYSDKTPDPSKRCDNCQLWQGGDAARGGCAIFPGKSVAAEGWCSAWVKKA